MRLVMLTTSASHHPSPRGRWIPLAHHLVAFGVTTTVLCLHPQFDAAMAQTPHGDGVTIRHVAQMHVDAAGPLRGWRLYAQVVAATWHLTRHAIRLRPDVVCICKAQPSNGLAGLIVRLVTGARLVLDSDDDEAGSHSFAHHWQHWLVAGWERVVSRRVASVSTASRVLAQRARQWGCTTVAQIATGVTIPTHYVPIPYHLPPQYLVYVGNLALQAHGLDVLLQALVLDKNLPPLVIAGSGHDATTLHAHAVTLGVAARCLWLGAIPAAHIPTLLHGAVASIDPIRADTMAAAARFPLKIIESLAVGTPVITSPVGDRGALVGDAGILVPAGDAHALAQACATIMTQSFERASVQRQVAGLQWAQVAQQWGVLHQLV